MQQRDLGFDPFRGQEAVFSDEAIIGRPDCLRWVLGCPGGLAGIVNPDLAALLGQVRWWSGSRCFG